MDGCIEDATDVESRTTGVEGRSHDVEYVERRTKGVDVEYVERRTKGVETVGLDAQVEGVNRRTVGFEGSSHGVEYVSTKWTAGIGGLSLGVDDVKKRIAGVEDPSPYHTLQILPVTSKQ